MQKICSSNPPLDTGICDPNKSQAQHHHSLKLGSTIKFCIRSRLLSLVFINYCLEDCYSYYKITFKLELRTNLKTFPFKKKTEAQNSASTISFTFQPSQMVQYFSLMSQIKKILNEKCPMLNTFQKELKKKQKKTLILIIGKKKTVFMTNCL